MGLRISKSEVSRICQGLDEGRGLPQPAVGGPLPYLWLDAKIEKVREGGRVVPKALVIAYAVQRSGYREVSGVDVGSSENGALWLGFLRGLVRRGLTDVQLVVSDAHNGLKAAIAQTLGALGSAAPSIS